MRGMQDEAERASARILAALARGDWHAALEPAYAGWGPLISYRPELLEQAALAVPPAGLDAVPEWRVIRGYLRRMRMRPDLRPAVYSDDASAPGPDAPASTRAVLFTSRASGARTAGRYDEAKTWAERAESAAREDARSSGTLRGLVASLLVECALAHEFAGQPTRAMALLREAFVCAEETRNARDMADAAGELAWLLALAGYREADDWLARHDTLLTGGPRIEALTISSQLARALRLWDALDFDAAERELARIDPHDVGEHLLFVAAARLMIGSRVSRDQGTALLSHFDTRISAMPVAHVASGLNGELNRIVRADLLFIRGEAAAVLRLLADLESPTAPFVTARRAIAHLLADEDDIADRLATEALDDPRTWVRLRIEMNVVHAIAARRRGDVATAAERFRAAVDETAEHGCFMAFTLAPRTELEELIGLLEADATPPWLRRLTSGTIALPPARQRIVRVTRREERLIAALSEDADEQSLAAALSVSRNTVRSQLHTLYRKFDVNSRGALRAAARRQGLL
ncbi:LuxR C-terminal-related transcriptional regulator [Microbacterium sp. JZ31]|uniref:LuxR C-terminal-related transcriptional regulator n=1 Tax=Microbacterium sp. JZ31 TaxID=1906274 RepID=UPI001933EB07|nr:LuxR C-terminal-related transcriptional regulator [Microbacterium sp. JZ31]